MTNKRQRRATHPKLASPFKATTRRPSGARDSSSPEIVLAESLRARRARGRASCLPPTSVPRLGKINEKSTNVTAVAKVDGPLCSRSTSPELVLADMWAQGKTKQHSDVSSKFSATARVSGNIHTSLQSDPGANTHTLTPPATPNTMISPPINFHFFTTNEALGGIPCAYRQCDTQTKFFNHAASALGLVDKKFNQKDLVGVTVLAENLTWPMILPWNQSGTFNGMMEVVKSMQTSDGEAINLKVTCIVKG